MCQMFIYMNLYKSAFAQTHRLVPTTFQNPERNTQKFLDSVELEMLGP
jgi:hypothetical protein